MASTVLPRANPLLIFGPRLWRLDLPVQCAAVLRRSKRLVHVSSAITAFSRQVRTRKSNTLQGGCCADASVYASDDKYGNKQVISVTPRLYDYLLTNVREPEILRQLREETATMRGSQMQVSPDQAQLLALLVQMIGAEKCIEVGVYTGEPDTTKFGDFVKALFSHTTNKISNKGYSSLAIALVLPESGRLVACEKDAISLEVARRYYDQAGVSHKVDVKHGLAADALKSMIQKGETCSYDFAFVDAEKRMYSEYFELLLQLVRVGGLIVIDNVLWHGKVANPLVNDSKTVSIRNFNRSIMEDKRVSISMIVRGPLASSTRSFLGGNYLKRFGSPYQLLKLKGENYSKFSDLVLQLLQKAEVPAGLKGRHYLLAVRILPYADMENWILCSGTVRCLKGSAARLVVVSYGLSHSTESTQTYLIKEE